MIPIRIAIILGLATISCGTKSKIANQQNEGLGPIVAPPISHRDSGNLNLWCKRPCRLYMGEKINYCRSANHNNLTAKTDGHVCTALRELCYQAKILGIKPNSVNYVCTFHKYPEE